MFKKSIALLIILGFLLTVMGCPSDEDDPTGLTDEQMKEYGFTMIFICSLLTMGSPDVTSETVGDVTTYTYTAATYNDEDADATVSGTIVETDDGSTFDNVLDLTFSNDDMGLLTITGNFGGTSGGDITTGTIMINDISATGAELQAFIDSLTAK